MNFISKLSVVILTIVLVSCNYFINKEESAPVARVKDKFLYTDEIEALLPQTTSTEDSIILVNNYINRWATQLLLYDGAQNNLSLKQQNDFNKLVSEYKYDLYTKAYLNALVKKTLDTIVTQQEAQQVYKSNKLMFKLNEDLVKFRYIQLPLETIEIESVEDMFLRYEISDQEVLDSLKIHFKSYFLNDSTWVAVKNIKQAYVSKLFSDQKQLLKKTNFIKQSDSIGISLIHVENMLLSGDYAPLEYVKSTVDKIVINKRKLTLIKQLENDITKDAIKNNQFEIYK
ncbi:MAG: peptidyl-prolyl cis-trans isomerase [Flavobacteriaceae bacterium]